MFMCWVLCFLMALFCSLAWVGIAVDRVFCCSHVCRVGPSYLCGGCYTVLCFPQARRPLWRSRSVVCLKRTLSDDMVFRDEGGACCQKVHVACSVLRSVKGIVAWISFHLEVSLCCFSHLPCSVLAFHNIQVINADILLLLSLSLLLSLKTCAAYTVRTFTREYGEERVHTVLVRGFSTLNLCW